VNIIAQQFKLIGGNDFKQPFIHPTSIGIGFTGNSSLILRNISSGTNKAFTISPLALKGDIAEFSRNVYRTLGPFNNMGIPGAKVIQIMRSGFGNLENDAENYNPFFARMTSNKNSASIL